MLMGRFGMVVHVDDSSMKIVVLGHKETQVSHLTEEFQVGDVVETQTLEINGKLIEVLQIQKAVRYPYNIRKDFVYQVTRTVYDWAREHGLSTGNIEREVEEGTHTLVVTVNNTPHTFTFEYYSDPQETINQLKHLMGS